MTSAEPIVLVAPMPPTLSNSARGRSRHWRALEREKAEYWLRLDVLLMRGELPAPPAARIARAAVRSAMVLGGAMDDDNALARHKWLLDWCVTRGYLAGDRKKHLVWEAFPSQRVTRKAPASITLTLTPLSPIADADGGLTPHR